MGTIYNMACGKVPMTYRGTKTVSLCHFDLAPSSKTPPIDLISGNEWSGTSINYDSDSKFGLGSLSSSSFLISNKLLLGKSPFCIEYFLKNKSFNVSNTYIKIGNYSKPRFGFSTTTNGFATIIFNGVETILMPFEELRERNNWHHISLVGDGKPDSLRSIKIFFDGILKHTVVQDYELDNNSMTIYGNIIDEFRISNVARYTENFTPPTAPFVVD